MKLEDNYYSKYQGLYTKYLKDIAINLAAHIENSLDSVKRIDRVSARAKSPDKFFEKSNKLIDGKLKYDDPFSQIQDQIGARVIVFYLDDVESVSQEISKYYRAIENQYRLPESEDQFGYFGQHFILSLPEDVFDETPEDVALPSFFELQIKTLFQHAWSEANHDLAYKPTDKLTPLQKRKIAFSAAQAWGADQLFNDMHQMLSANDP